MTPERLAEIKARAEAATNADLWRCSAEEFMANEDDEFPMWVTPVGPRQKLDEYGDGDDARYAQAKADALFCQEARQDIPDLLAEIERLSEALRQIADSTK